MAKKKEPELTPAEKLAHRRAKIAETMKVINKGQPRPVIQFGPPSIEMIPTGFSYLDQLMGGGIMKGRILTMMGSEQSGKTTLSALIMAAALRQDKSAIWYWLDFENSLYENKEVKANKKTGQSPKEKSSWLATLGVDTSRVVFIHSLQTMEDYCNILINDLQDKEDVLVNGVVIDSVGAMMPQGVAYKKVGANLKQKGLEADTMALLARSLGKFLSIVKGPLARNQAPMIAITHVYADIGMGGFLIPKGGNAFRHYADMRLNLKRGPRKDWPWNEKDDNQREIHVGFDLSITLDKTKNSASMAEKTQINLPFIHGIGIDENRFRANRALYDGYIHQAGAYYYLQPDLSIDKPYKERDIKIQGVTKFWAFINGDDAIKETLKEKYLGINFFLETSDQIEDIVINNLDKGDEDIIEAASEAGKPK